MFTRRLALVLGAGLFATTFALGVVHAWLHHGVLPAVDQDPLSEGKWLLEHGDLARALAQLRMVAQVEPAKPDGWVRLGQALAAAGDRAGAIAAFERSLQLVPVSTFARQQLAALYLQAGRVEEAQRQAAIARADGADLPPVLLQLVSREAEPER